MVGKGRGVIHDRLSEGDQDVGRVIRIGAGSSDPRNKKQVVAEKSETRMLLMVPDVAVWGSESEKISELRDTNEARMVTHWLLLQTTATYISASRPKENSSGREGQGPCSSAFAHAPCLLHKLVICLI